MNLRRYLATLSPGRTILWCYLIWYVVVLVKYFDPSARLWLTSLGLSAIIGFALYLSTAGSGTTRVRFDRWQVFRLFLMPFCVSSFAALVKGKNFVLIFSPDPRETVLAVLLCAAFLIVVWLVKGLGRAT
jgi:L-asparagine transporter-like permease